MIAIGIDIQNAFNFIQWSEIKRVLKNKEFPDYLQKIIANYLSDRAIVYTNDEKENKIRYIEAGVPQGSVLGPLFWNVTFDEVLQAKIEKKCELIAYADDLLILASGYIIERRKKRIYGQLINTITMIKKLKLKIAANKTEIVVFTNDRRIPQEISVTIEEEKIKSKRSLKYLGIIIDDKLSFVRHIEYIQEKVEKVIGRALWRLLPNLRGPKENKRRLYASVLSSIILYGAPAWADAVQRHGKTRHILRTMHRNVRQRITAAYKTVSRDAAMI